MNNKLRENTLAWTTGTLAAILLISMALGCSWLGHLKTQKACVTAKTYDGPNPPEPGSPAAQILGCWAKDGDKEFIRKFENGYFDVVYPGGDTYRGATKYSFIDRSTIQFGNPRSSSGHVSQCSVETEENFFTMECQGEYSSKTTVQRFRRLYSASFDEPQKNTNNTESK